MSSIQEEQPKPEQRETLERIATAAKVDNPEAAANELRKGQNKLTDIVLGLCTGSCAAIYGAYAGLANVELLNKNAEKIQWEPSPEGFATVGGAALAAGTAAYFIPKVTRLVKTALVNLPKSIGWQRGIDRTLRTAGLLAAIGTAGILSSLGQYAATGAPKTIGIPGKRIAGELAGLAVPSGQYCTLLRNMRYVSGIPERGLYIFGVTVTASPRGATFTGNPAFKSIARCEISTPIGEILKGRHNVQDKHDAHPQADEGFYTIDTTSTPPQAMSGRNISCTIYNPNQFLETKFGLVHGLTFQGLGSPTSTARQLLFGETIDEAVVELNKFSDTPMLSSIMNDLPEVPQGNYLVYATKIEGRIRLRARAEDGTEHDITRFTSDSHPMSSYKKGMLRGFLEVAEKAFNDKK